MQLGGKEFQGLLWMWLWSPAFPVPGPAQLPGGARYRLFQWPLEWRCELRIVGCICWSCWWRQGWLQLLFRWLYCWRWRRHTCPGTVTSHASGFPLDHGRIVVPSCRRRPTGSLTDGIWALFIACLIMSLRCEWRCCLGALFRQASRWSPRASTTLLLRRRHRIRHVPVGTTWKAPCDPCLP